MNQTRSDAKPVTTEITPNNKSVANSRGKITQLVKRVGYRIYRLSGELVAILLGTAFIWVSLLNIVLAKREIDASFLSDNMSIWFAQAFDGKSANVDAIKLRWNPASNTMEIENQGIQVNGTDGEPLQTLDNSKIALDVEKLLAGAFETRRASLSGGSVTLSRRENGHLLATIGTPQAAETFSPLFSRMPNQSQSTNAGFGALEQLQISGATIYLEDEIWGLSWVLNNAELNLENSNGLVDLNFSSQILSQDSASGDFQARFEFPQQLSKINGDVTFSKASLQSLAPKSGPAAFLNQIAGDADISVLIERSETDSRLSAEISMDNGQLILPGNNYGFSDFDLAGEIDLGANSAEIVSINFESQKIDLNGSGKISVQAEPGIYEMAIEAEKVRLDLSEVFDGPFQMEDVGFEGMIDSNIWMIALDEFLVDFGGFDISGSGEIDLTDRFSLESIKMIGDLDGEFSKTELLSLWPTRIGKGARDWIERSILAGELFDLTFDLDIPSSAIRNQMILDEHLTLDFAARNADVRYISTMSILTDVSGTGRLYGNRMEFDVASGNIGNMILDTGKIEIPRLNPKGGDFTIDVTGHGPVLEMMQLIDQKPFEFASRYGVDPNKFAGTGEIDMTITRPLLEFFPQERIRYDVEGRFQDVKAPFSFGESQIEDGDVNLSADKNGMTLSGPVTLGGWDVDLHWAEEFTEDKGPTKISLDGIMDRDALDGFGIGLREYIGGTSQVRIDAEGQGLDVRKADIQIDLLETDIQFGSYWTKAAGQPGSLKATAFRDPERGTEISGMQLNSDGISLNGDLRLGPELQLENLSIPRAVVEGLVDAALNVSPSPDGDQIQVDIEGAYLDISEFISRGLRAERSEFALPMLLNAKIARLALNDGYQVENAKVELDHKGFGLSRLDVSGRLGEEPLILRIAPNAAQTIREIEIKIPDAARAASAFAGLSNIRNGHLTMTGSLPPVGEEGPVSGEFIIDDFKLINAPVFARMLSMASLKGLTDLMGGEGVHFQKVQIPFRFEKGHLVIREAVASGAALGMTGDGDIHFGQQTVDLDGVLVPAYTANSMLGSVPVIGDIFVGKKGEGIFALSYAIKGPFKQTQISVNPLSALTPGFLRQIFDPVRDVRDVEVPIPENLTPTDE